MKYCIDCEHFKSPNKCINPETNGRHLTNGEAKVRPADANRYNSDYCGLSARGFTPKISLWTKIKTVFWMKYGTH